MMTLASVNRALPRRTRLGDRTLHTAIEKLPADGRVGLGPLGLEGDGVGSPKHHGGPDQAVYLYGTDDYRWWETELGRRLPPGWFGENLTIDGLRSSELSIGDRFHIGEAVIVEVSAPRIPCGTLAARMRDGEFAAKFRAARRPGAYARVIHGGTVGVGDPIEWVPEREPVLSLLDMFALFYDRSAPSEVYANALAAPIAERARVEYERLANRPADAG